jgi:hypothetical protein
LVVVIGVMIVGVYLGIVDLALTAIVRWVLSS